MSGRSAGQRALRVPDGLRGGAALNVLPFHICEMAVPDAAHNPMAHGARPAAPVPVTAEAA